MRPGVIRLLVTILLAAAANGAVAQATRSPEAGGADRALAKAQLLLRQVAKEKAELQAALAKAVAERDDLQERLKQAQAALDESQSALSSADAERKATAATLASTRKRLDTTDGKLQDVAGRWRETTATLRATEEARARLEADLAAVRAELDRAQAANEAQTAVSRELMDAYARKGPWEALLQREPLTGLKQVEIENRLEAVRDRVEEGVYLRPQAGPAAATATTAAP